MAVVQRGVPELRGYNIDDFRAFAKRGKKWEVIPLQIDEVNRRGDLVLADGMPFTRNSDDRIFDDNDDFVLRGSDLGDDFNLKTIPKDYKRSAAHWKVDVCAGENYAGSALIVHDVSLPKYAAAQPDVIFDRQTLVATSSFYRYVFRKEHPALLGQVFLRDGAGESPVFADSSFRMPLVLPWWAPNFTWSPNHFKSEVESWQVGPIRTVVAVGVKLRNFLSAFNFHMFSELVFYKQHFQIPTVIEFTFDPASYFKPGSGVGYSLSFAKGTSWSIDTNLVELPQNGPDTAVADSKRASDFPHFFAKGSSDKAAFYVKVRVDRQAAMLVPPPYIVRHEMFGQTPWAREWPWLRDLRGDLGIFIDISRVRKGTYDFGLDLVLASKADDVAPSWFESLRTTWHPHPAVE